MWKKITIVCVLLMACVQAKAQFEEGTFLSTLLLPD